MKTTCPFCLTEQEIDPSLVKLRTSNPVRCTTCSSPFLPTILQDPAEAPAGSNTRNFNKAPEIRVADGAAADETIMIDEGSAPAEPTSVELVQTEALTQAHAHGHGQSQSQSSTHAHGAAQTPTAPTSQAQRIADRYKLIEEISRGGMGAIFRARDRILQREVAIKVIRSNEDQRRSARFAMEAQVTGQLEHPNIVPVHDLGRNSSGRPFFAMKLVRGQTLAALIAWHRHDAVAAEAEYPLVRMLGILIHVCNAIGFAHSRGVIHRDIKPANIMVGDFGEVLMMDWGLAKILAGGSVGENTLRGAGASSSSADVNASSANLAPAGAAATTSSFGQTSGLAATGTATPGKAQPLNATNDNAVVGTPVYMSPEQALGKIADMDARSDIYALGAILYEILTLHPPIQGQDLNEVLLNVTTGRIIHPSKRNKARRVPQELGAIALKAMATDPAQRYDSAIAMRRDIEAYIGGHRVSVATGHPGSQVIRVVRRNLVASVAVAASLVAVTTAVVLIAGTGRGPAATTSQPISEDRRRTGLLTAAAEQIGKGGFAEARTQLDGFPTETRDWVWRRLDLLCSLHLASPRTGGTPLSSLTVSGDGQIAAAAADDGMVEIYDLASGRRTASMRLHPGRVRAMALDASGAVLVTGGDDAELRVWQPGGAPAQTRSGHEAPVTAVSVDSASGRIASGDAQGSVRLWNAAGESAVLGKLDAEIVSLAMTAGDDGVIIAATAKGSVATWRLGDRREIARRRFDGQPLALTPDGRRLLVAGGTGTRIHELANPEVAVTIAELGNTTAAAFSPDAARVVTSAGAGVARVWDARSGRLLVELRGHRGKVTDVATRLLPGDEGRYEAVTVGDDGSLRTWDGLRRRDLVSLSLGNALVAAAVSADGRRAAVGSGSTATVWDLATRKPVQTAILGKPIRAIAFSPDGKSVVAAGDGGVAKIIGGAVVQAPPAAFLAVTFSPDSRWFATGSEDGKVRVWAIEGGSEICSILAHTGKVAAVAFSPDGRTLASSGADGQVRLSSLPDGRAIRLIKTGAATTLSWLPDGTAIATPSDQGATLWDAESGTIRTRFGGHAGAVAQVAFDGKGTLAFTAGADGTVRVAEVRSGLPLLTLRDLDAPPLALALSSGRGDLVTVLANGTAIIHPATPPTP